MNEREQNIISVNEPLKLKTENNWEKLLHFRKELADIAGSFVTVLCFQEKKQIDSVCK